MNLSPFLCQCAVALLLSRFCFLSWNCCKLCCCCLTKWIICGNPVNVWFYFRFGLPCPLRPGNVSMRQLQSKRLSNGRAWYAYLCVWFPLMAFWIACFDAMTGFDFWTTFIKHSDTECAVECYSFSFLTCFVHSLHSSRNYIVVLLWFPAEHDVILPALCFSRITVIRQCYGVGLIQSR